MLYAAQLQAGKPVTPKLEDGGETLHISQACLVDPKDSNKTYVQLIDGDKTICIAALEKDKCENVSLDLYLSTTENIKISTRGGNNEVHLVGYFEPESSRDYDDDDDEDFENEDTLDYLKKMNENSSDEEEEDDDDDDDDENDEENFGEAKKQKKYTPKIEEIDDNEFNKLKKLQNAGKKSVNNKNAVGAKVDDTEKNKNAKAKTNDKLKAKQNKTDDSVKRKSQAEINTNNNPKKQKQVKTSQDEAGLDDNEDVTVESFHSELVKYLKSNGKTNMSILGQKIKKPSSIEKLGGYVKEHPEIFKVENVFVSLV